MFQLAEITSGNELRTYLLRHINREIFIFYEETDPYNFKRYIHYAKIDGDFDVSESLNTFFYQVHPKIIRKQIASYNHFK